MSRLHPASLIKSSEHPQDLLDFFELDAQNHCVIDYIVRMTTDVAAHALRFESTETKRSSLLVLSDRMHKRYCGFRQFVSNVIRRSQMSTSTVLVALLYLKKAKHHLDVPPVDWILHQLFLGALILAAKYTIDAPHRNCEWADITGIFGRRDIGKMEFQMFEVLDMKLSFTEEELKQLRLEILDVYATELAYLVTPRPDPACTKSKTPRSRSPDSGDLPRRKKTKFIVEEEEEDESDGESESGFESDELYRNSGLENSPAFPSPSECSTSVSSSSSASSAITPPERHPVRLVRSRACMNLRAGFHSRPYLRSPQTQFSPTIEVPMVDPGATLENFTKSSAAGWQLLQWFKASPWTGTKN